MCDRTALLSIFLSLLLIFNLISKSIVGNRGIVGTEILIPFYALQYLYRKICISKFVQPNLKMVLRIIDGLILNK